MLLYKSRNIILKYNIAAAILSVEWPTMKEPSISEVRQALQVLVNYVRKYNIENLLLNESENVFIPNKAEYKLIVNQFKRALLSTNLKRVARVVTSQVEREEAIKNLIKMLEPEVVLKNFNTRTAAIAWLVGVKGVPDLSK
jgi:hypothetical protein